MAKGGTRPGAGRKKGEVGKARRGLGEMAKEHAEAALLALVEIAQGNGAASARVYAATAILDRAYGRSRQALEHSKSVDDSLAKLLGSISGSAYRPVEHPND